MTIYSTIFSPYNYSLNENPFIGTYFRVCTYIISYFCPEKLKIQIKNTNKS